MNLKPNYFFWSRQSTKKDIYRENLVIYKFEIMILDLSNNVLSWVLMLLRLKKGVTSKNNVR